ncbi:DUF11 domain-containing protein [Variovorax boronicumulans]|uniref:DUF11 domain-containing protein n=1 Tax=Variovorax boronicumulans TaxID=436515 RepID=UPI000BB3D4C5|nr:DUF11 domain-containing protein [Variovorax boronicumulans]
MSPVVRLTVRLGLGLGVAMTLGLGGLAAAQGTKAAPTPTEAAQKKTVAVVLTQAKVVKDAQGKEQLVAADSVKPGDVLEYTATYTNHTGKAVTGLVANLPIPEGLEYLPKTAKPGATLVKAATKDGAFAAEPLARVVNGKSEPVPYNEYRSLRWTLGQLPANGSAAVTARAKVETVVPPAPVAAAADAQKVARSTP